MGLKKYWTVDQIDQAILALKPGHGYRVVGDAVLPTLRKRIVKSPKKKTKRGRRGRTK